MSNTGPDGKSRCGFLRGKACEQKAYEAEMSMKKKIEDEIAKDKSLPVASIFSTTNILIVVAVIVVLVIAYKYLKK